MSWPRRALLLPLAGLLLAASAVPEPVGVSEEVRVEVVNVDVWVTDKNGAPLDGLAIEDFELYEDGRRVEITNFFAVGLAAGEAPGDEPATPGPQPAPEALSAPGLVVLYVDNTLLVPSHRDRALGGLEKFVEDGGLAGQRVLVTTWDPHLDVLAGPTSKVDEIVSALRHAAEKPALGTHDRARRASMMNEVRFLFEDIGCRDAFDAMMSVVRNYAVGSEGSVQVAQNGLTRLVRSLAAFPGRKQVLYLSDGLQIQPGLEDFIYVADLCPHRQFDAWPETVTFDQTAALKRIAAYANANEVTLHSLEMAGFPMSSMVSAETDVIGSLPSPQIDALRRMNLRGSLVTLADETGGRVISNPARLVRALGTLMTGLGSYYSLGFAPDHAGDGEVHQIQVALRQGVGKRARLRHRRRYRDTPDEERIAERVLATLVYGLEDNPLGARVRFAASESATEGAAALLEIELPLDRLLTRPSEAGDEGLVRLVVLTEDAEGRVSAREKLHPFLRGRSALGEERQLLVVGMELAAGGHTVGVGIRDELAGETAYLRAEIEVETERRAG